MDRSLAMRGRTKPCGAQGSAALPEPAERPDGSLAACRRSNRCGRNTPNEGHLGCLEMRLTADENVLSRGLFGLRTGKVVHSLANPGSSVAKRGSTQFLTV